MVDERGVLNEVLPIYLWIRRQKHQLQLVVVLAIQRLKIVNVTCAIAMKDMKR